MTGLADENQLAGSETTSPESKCRQNDSVSHHFDKH
jgi:hypothetical protein